MQFQALQALREGSTPYAWRVWHAAHSGYLPVMPAQEPTVQCKPCRRCGVVKPSTEFYKNKTNADGLYNNCKACFGCAAALRAALTATACQACAVAVRTVQWLTLWTAALCGFARAFGASLTEEWESDDLRVWCIVGQWGS